MIAMGRAKRLEVGAKRAMFAGALNVLLAAFDHTSGEALTTDSEAMRKQRVYLRDTIDKVKRDFGREACACAR